MTSSRCFTKQSCPQVAGEAVGDSAFPQHQRWAQRSHGSKREQPVPCCSSSPWLATNGRLCFHLLVKGAHVLSFTVVSKKNCSAESSDFADKASPPPLFVIDEYSFM